MSSLLVVSGPPGAGKSTIAAALADRLDPSALVEGDQFFRFLRSGAIEPWRPESQRQNEVIVRIQAATARRYRDGGYHTVFDGVIGPWFLDSFRAATNGPFEYVVLLPSLDVCLERIRSRDGHDFSDEAAARSMHTQFVEACGGWREHVVDSASGSPTDVADTIESRRASGRLWFG